MITPDSPFLSPPRIPIERWMALWDDVGYSRMLFPGMSTEQARAEVADWYGLLVRANHDPLVWFCIPGREHNWGMNETSVLWRNDTRSLTNARTVRLPGLGHELIIDSVRRSQYVRYRSARDSLRDGMYRITDPTHRYVKEGRRTLAEVFGAWTEDPAEYAAWMVDKMNQILGDAPMATGDMPGVPFIAADERHYTPGRSGGKWPDRYIWHHTNGVDSLAWLTTSPNSNVSSTYLHNRDGTVRAQLVRHKDTPHTTGEWNDESLSSEWERLWSDPAQREIPDSTYANLADHMAKVVRIERARGNPHFQGPLRRDQVRDHNDYYNTTCPGNLDVGRIWEIAAAILSGDTDTSDALVIPGNPYGDVSIVAGFRDYVIALGTERSPADVNAGILSVFGWPEATEYRTSFGSAQVFERMTLLWFRDTPAPWDIVPALRGTPPPEQAA